MAHTRQSWPDPGLDFQIIRFKLFPLCSEADLGFSEARSADVVAARHERLAPTLVQQVTSLAVYEPANLVLSRVQISPGETCDQSTHVNPK